jgi:NTE family protein
VTAQVEPRTTEQAAEEARAWRAFAVASVSIFMFVLDAGLLSVSLPEIERAFPDSSRATISWVSTGYLVSVAGFMLVAGRMGDVYGRKRVFRGGLLVLAFGAFLTGISPTIGLLIAARMLQGVGGALVTATALTLVLSDLPESRRPFAIGIWGSAGSVAAVLGPTLGAEILDLTSWRFTVTLIGPISLATWFVGRNVLREATDPDAPDHLAPLTVAVATIGIGGLALGLSQSRVWGWSDPKTITALIVGTIAFGLFLLSCNRATQPLLPLRLFGIGSYSGATISAGLQQIGFFSWFFSTSFVLREIWGWSVRETGQAISLAFICSTLSGWFSGKAAERFGYFWPTTIGAVVAAAGPLYWFIAFDAEPSFWLVYLPGAALFGLGGGACGVLTTGIALKQISASDQGMAYAAHQTVRRMSSAFGLALMATLLGEASGAELLSGGRNVWLLSAGVHFAMVLPLIPSHMARGRVSST